MVEYRGYDLEKLLAELLSSDFLNLEGNKHHLWNTINTYKYNPEVENLKNHRRLDGFFTKTENLMEIVDLYLIKTQLTAIAQIMNGGKYDETILTASFRVTEENEIISQELKKLRVPFYKFNGEFYITLTTPLELNQFAELSELLDLSKLLNQLQNPQKLLAMLNQLFAEQNNSSKVPADNNQKVTELAKVSR